MGGDRMVRLESANKMHELTASYIEPHEFEDYVLEGIYEQAKQGNFTYGFQGELNEPTIKQLRKMGYIVDVRKICDKTFTKIGW